jgi:AbiEi antitoxin C-terminal domain
VTTKSPAAVNVIATASDAESPDTTRSVPTVQLLPSELRPFRRAELPAAEADGLLEQRLARRVIADVLVAFDVPDSREIRSAAVALLVPEKVQEEHNWVLGFTSAAWLHTGFGAAGRDGPAELQVIIPPGRRRPRTIGIRGRQIALPAEHVTFVDGIAVTHPIRTAADVARDLPTAEALPALRRLGELAGVRPDQVLRLLATMRYARGAATARRLIRDWAEQG